MRKLLHVVWILLLFVSCSSNKKKQNESSEQEVASSPSYEQQKLPYKSKEDYQHLDSLDDVEKISLAYVDTEKLKTLKSNDFVTQLFVNCYLNDFSEARKMMKQKGFQYFSWPSYWHAVGFCYQKQNEPRKASLYYNKALELTKNYPPAINNLALLYFSEDLREKALKSFQVNINSKSYVISRLNYLRILIMYNLVDEARRVISSLKVDQKLYQKERAFIELYSGNYEKARDLYSDLPTKELDLSYVKMNYALALYHSGEGQKAKEMISSIGVSSLDERQKQYLANVRGAMK